MTTRILRKWIRNPECTIIKHFYDMGDQQWHLLPDGSIQTNKILKRTVLEDKITVLEEVLLLPETPVPLEAHQQEVKGWLLSEEVVSSPLSPPSLQKTKEEYSKKQPQTLQREQPLPNQTPRAQRSPKGSEFEEEEFSQQLATLPTELWLSLSQWIPPNALFQPSLHHQAILELLEQPNPTFVVPKVQVPYSRTRPMRHQHGVRGVPPKYVPLKGFAHKPRVQSEFVKPLFI
jgi:hypothetical protein